MLSRLSLLARSVVARKSHLLHKAEHLVSHNETAEARKILLQVIEENPSNKAARRLFSEISESAQSTHQVSANTSLS